MCYLTNNIVKLTVSQLKPILISFYNDEELCRGVLITDSVTSPFTTIYIVYSSALSIG